jgi:AcrR family transcriptional regulator
MSELPASDPKQRMPAQARRRQLLEVALEKFAARGFHETSMEEIADAAGVTKPVLYQHFHSKQDLFLELLESEGGDLQRLVMEGAAAESDPYQQVLAGFRAYFGFVCNRTSAFQLLFGSGARLADEFTDSVRRLEEAIALVIGRFIDADIDAEYRDLLGHAIVGLGEVAGRRWLVTHDADRLDPADADRIAVRMADLVWAGLRALPPESH